MRNLNMTVTCWMMALVAGLFASSGYGATVFHEDFDGSNGPWGGMHIGNDWQGDIIPGKNGWVQTNPDSIGITRIIIDNTLNPGDNRTGVARTNGGGNTWDGFGNGAGAAHSFNAGGDKIVASFMTNLNGQALGSPLNPLTYNGEVRLLLGDATITTESGNSNDNAYLLGLGKTFVEPGLRLGGAFTPGTPIDTGFLNVAEWFEAKIEVTDVGSPAETARAFWRDIDDATGLPTGDGSFTLMGIFPKPNSLFALNHIGTEQFAFSGGASGINIDGIRVEDNIPEPATIGLLGMSALGLMRRRR